MQTLHSSERSYVWLIFCVLFSSHYKTLFKSPKKFKQWHFQFFEALARRDSHIARRESRIARRDLVSREEILVSQEGGNLLLSGT